MSAELEEGMSIFGDDPAAETGTGSPSTNGSAPSSPAVPAALDVDALAEVLRTTDVRPPVDVAAHLAELGVPVLPTVPGQKAPMLTTLHIAGVDANGERVADPCAACSGAGLRPAKDHGATVDPATVVRYWAVHPDAGVGMKNHPQLVRGDGDHADRKALRKAWKEITYTEPHGAPPPFAASTPGGDHRRRYLHTLPDGVPAPGGPTVVFGVSWYGSSGYVVVKGGHPKGRQYPPFRGEQITPLPMTVAANLTHSVRDRTDAPVANSAEVDAFLGTWTGTARLDLLARRRRALAGAAEGERHPLAIGMLCGVMTEAIAGYYPARLAHDMLTDALRDAGWTADRFDGEWTGMVGWAIGHVGHLTPDEARAQVTTADDERIAKTLDDAYTAEYIASLDEEVHRDLTSDELDALVAKQQDGSKDADDDTEADGWRVRIRGGADWLRSGSDHVEALWGGGDNVPCPKAQPTIIGGRTGAGKTTLAQHIMLGTIGTPGYAEVLGWPVARLPADRTALYLASDRPDQARLAMRRLISTAEQWHAVERRLRVWTGPPPVSIASAPMLLLHMAEEAGAGLVVVDSLKDMALQLTDDRVAGAMNEAHQHLVANGIDVISLHHPRKQTRDNPDARLTIDDLYGGAWLAAGAGSVLMLSKEPTCIEALQVKTPNGCELEFRYVMDPTTGAVTAGAIDGVLAAVRAGVTGISTAAIARVIFAAAEPERAQVESVRRQLHRLEESGVVLHEGTGRNSRWTPT